MVPPPAWFAGAKRLSPEGRSLPPEPGCKLWAAAFTSLVAPTCSLVSSFPLGAPTPGSLPSCRGSIKTRRGPPAQSPSAATHAGQPPGASPAAANPRLLSLRPSLMLLAPPPGCSSHEEARSHTGRCLRVTARRHLRSEPSPDPSRPASTDLRPFAPGRGIFPQTPAIKLLVYVSLRAVGKLHPGACAENSARHTTGI